jgi:hypothetical protein
MRAFFLPLLALFLLVPTVAAQAPSATLAADGLSQKYLAASEVQLAPFTLILNVNNVVCTANVPLKVTVAATVTEAGAPTGNSSDNRSFSAIPSPAELTYTVPQGAYGNNAGLPAARPFQGRQSATIAVTARNLTNSSSVDVSYVATFAGYSGTDCRGNGALGAAENKGAFKVEFSATEPPLPEPSPELPVPASLVWVALAAALLIMRRRSA